MTKNIKDYLHLYLGCEVVFEKCSYHFVHSLYIHRGDKKELNEFLLYEISRASGLIIKPLLRPLYDMNDDERLERDRFAGLETPYYYHFPLETVWYLKQGFDLFNLIPEGLAIDKTKPSNI